MGYPWRVAATINPGARMHALLEYLGSGPMSRDEVRSMDTYRHLNDGAFATALHRDLTELARLGYIVEREEDDDGAIHYSLSHAGNVAVDLNPLDMSLLRHAAASLDRKTELHDIATRTVTKLLGSARSTSTSTRLAISLPIGAILLDIAHAIEERRPLDVDYQSAGRDRPERRILEVHSAWENYAHIYLRARPIHDGEVSAELRTYRADRITKVHGLLDATDYEIIDHDEDVTPSLTYGTYVVQLRPGAGEHIRERGTAVGVADDGWDRIELRDVALHDLYDDLNVLGTDARIEGETGWLDRLEHVSRLGGTP